uniref:Gustatory receptor n=1 Tax=Schizaphis graminum TaxID=13262 RepID=A0A2S2NEQ4_SCHGA
MDSSWIVNPKVTYYVFKVLGLLPFAGSRRVVISLLYSLLLWICLALSGIYVNMYHFKKNQNVSPRFSMLTKVIFIEVFTKFIVTIFSISISLHRSQRYFRVLEKFYKFDVSVSRIPCPPDVHVQTFYLLYVLFIGAHNYICSLNYTSMPMYVLLVWNLFSSSTTLVIVQFMIYIRMLRERYELANRIFKKSMLNNSFSETKYIHPKEMNNLFTELRELTEEVKTYYAYHAIIIIIETVIILVSSVTSLTVNYLSELDTKFVDNGYFIGHCFLRFLLLFFLVRETHYTTLEAKNTALIGHEALNITSDITIVNHFEIIILNCWNHPVVFDVLDFFDLDYKLLQSIIASVVTYVVVLVQIQLVIMEMVP